jgi:hypothetical protein
MTIFSFSPSTLSCRFFRIISLTLLLTPLTLMTTGCGLSNERGDRTGEEALDPRNNDQSDNTFEVKQIIGIRAESIDGKINRIDPSQISIVTLNENFNEISSRTLPAYRVEERINGLTGYELQFDKSYIEKVNQVVKVTFDQSTFPPVFLYAPLYILPETQSITVNAKSHYVLKKLFDTIDSAEELAALIPCPELQEPACPNQPMAKANFLEQINLTAQDYNIEINPEFSVEQALNLLNSRVDIRQHVEAAVNEITRVTSPFAKGTRRDLTLSTDDLLTPKNEAQSYNSVMFGLSLSSLSPDDTDRSVSIASSSSVVAPISRFNDEAPTYPAFFQNTFLFDLRRDVLSSDIPFRRTILSLFQNGIVDLEDNEIENAVTTNTTDSFLSTQGFLLNERSVQQVIDPQKELGWEFEPYFTRSYQVADPNLEEDDIDYGTAAPWLTSANYSKATAYQQTEQSPRAFRAEDMNFFTWEVHGLETDENFSTRNMSGKQYGVISYSLKLDDREGGDRMKLIAETAKWEIVNAGTILISQPSSHYQSYTLSRADNNDVRGILVENDLIDTPRAITATETEGSAETKIRGRVSLDGLDAPQGHASQNGSYVALSFNTKDRLDPLDRGQGIILATELTDFDFVFSGEQYQLQGNSFKMTESQNVLNHLNGSILTISAAEPGDPVDMQCRATLSAKRTTIVHQVDLLQNTLSGPQEISSEEVNNLSCLLDDNEIQLTFSSVFGELLTLKGFITRAQDASTFSPGNLINFIWHQNNELGLIFANREQSLSTRFE